MGTIARLLTYLPIYSLGMGFKDFYYNIRAGIVMYIALPCVIKGGERRVWGSSIPRPYLWNNLRVLYVAHFKCIQTGEISPAWSAAGPVCARVHSISCTDNNSERTSERTNSTATTSPTTRPTAIERTKRTEEEYPRKFYKNPKTSPRRGPEVHGEKWAIASEKFGIGHLATNDQPHLSV